MFKSVNIELDTIWQDHLKEMKNDGRAITHCYTANSYSKVPDRNALFECPFNKVHVVQRGKFSNHIQKCKKSPIFQNWLVCPYGLGFWVNFFMIGCFELRI